MTYPVEIDTVTNNHAHHDEAITPTSRVTLGLLWTIAVGMLAVTVFLWKQFDDLDEKFVTNTVFEERSRSIELRIDERTKTLQRQIERLEAALDRRDR